MKSAVFTVASRVTFVTQPYKGFLPKEAFIYKAYTDEESLVKVISALSRLQGLAVDYLARYMLTGNKENAFRYPIEGLLELAEKMNSKEVLFYGKNLLEKIKGLDDESIEAAVRFVGYELVYRAGENAYTDVKLIVVNQDLIQNIRILTNRTIKFFTDYGPVISCGNKFEDATKLIYNGDCDYITKDTLWEFWCSEKTFDSKWSLRLLMYYIMGLHSNYTEFDNVIKLGIFNPYRNESYVISVKDIKDETLWIVTHEVLGYKMRSQDYSTWYDVDGSDENIGIQIKQEALKDTGFDAGDYSDGIHQISRDDYRTYLSNLKGHIKTPSPYGWKNDAIPELKRCNNIFMLKREGYLMFINLNAKGKAFLLDGGKASALDWQMEYYYYNMVLYANNVLKRFSKFWDYLYSVSDQLLKALPDKRSNIGGSVLSGVVHGCIIDVDFSNHIWVNPYDGKLISYHAATMYDRDVYKNFESLIAAQKPYLLESLQRSSNGESTALIVGNNIDKRSQKVYDSSNYVLSRKLKQLQYIYDDRLIRAWYDEFLVEDVKKDLVDVLLLESK